MNKDLEILKYQSLKPVSENQDSLREIRKTSKNFAIVEEFLLIDQTKRRRSLRLVCKYLEGARFIK